MHTHEASRGAGGWMTVYACASVRPRQVYTGTAVRPLDGRKVSKSQGTDNLRALRMRRKNSEKGL